MTEKSNSIRKNPQFNKYGTEDRVSNKIESLEQDLVVSTYSIKDTRDVNISVPYFIVETAVYRFSKG